MFSRNSTLTKITLAATGAAVAAGTALGATATPAQAAGGDWATVNARGGLIIRTAPTVHAGKQGVLRDGQQVYTVCQASGTGFSDGGEQWDTAWYYVSLGTGSGGWVAGHYLKTHGSTPRCAGSGVRTGRTTTAVVLRQAPNTADQRAGVAYRGSTLKLACKVTSQRVRGNSVWYLTDHNQWISARYVRNVGPAPTVCG